MKYFHIILILLFTNNLVGAQISKPRLYKPVALKYDLGYGFIRGGVVNIDFNNIIDSGQVKHHIKLEVRTVGFMDRLYKIRDIYESYVDVETGLPTKAIRNISEGGYKRYNICKYDYSSHPDSTIIMSGYSGKIVTQKNIFDILSCYYFLRNNYFVKPLLIGDILKTTTYFTDEVFPIIMSYEGKKTIKTKFGEINCLVFSPVTEVGRVFETEDAMKVYISDDSNNYPVLIEFDFFLGSARCELTQIISL